VCKVQRAALSSAGSHTAALAKCCAFGSTWERNDRLQILEQDTSRLTHTQQHQTSNKTARNELCHTAFSATTELNEDVNYVCMYV
jgi:hypothetical protein